MRLLVLSFLFLITSAVLILPQYVEAATMKQTMEGSMDVEISYPDNVIVGRDFSISIFVQNNGWEDKQSITLSVVDTDDAISRTDNSELVIDRIATGGSYGFTVDFITSPNASIGTHYINLLYSQVLVKNNEEPQKSKQTNIAIPILIKSQPQIIIHTKAPESVFPNAEFPFEVEILSEDISLKNVQVQIIAPEDIDFRGETVHTFSSIQKNTPITLTSRIVTPQKDLTAEYKIPFEVIVSYTDDTNSENIESKTVPVVLRPRTFLELTTEGGIWIGDFFLAPYISIGTIVGIPAGAIIHLIIKRSQKKKKARR